MNVHINFGRHAGEVRDIAPEAALAMLADGRASRPGEELELHVGGVVSEVKPYLVGESITDCVIPRAIADRIEDAGQSRRRSRR